MTDTSHSHDAGPLAEEAARLVAAVQAWAQRTMPAPPSGHPGPECQWCPVCQLASALRGEHPELTARVGEAGAAVLAAVRTLAETVTETVTEAAAAPPSGEAAGGRSASPNGHGPSPRVQHITLSDPSESA